MERRMGTKGNTAAVFAVVGGGIALLVGIWVIALVINSFTLNTISHTVTNESINFATNDTYYSFAKQPACLTATPLPSNCGVTSITSIKNNTADYYATNSSCFIKTTSQIKGTFLMDPTCGGLKVGIYKVSYTYYSFQSDNANTALVNTRTSTFNAFTLLAVGLVVLAAATIVSYFGFGGKKGSY